MFGGVRHCVLQGKKTKYEPQRYSLTILTLVADQEIHNYSHFQVLFRIYFATFSLSKIFIIFRLERKSCTLWHGFCRDDKSSSANMPV